MAVTASLSSHVMLNQHLLEAVMGKSPSLRVVFSAYKDFTCILLCPSESGVYKFPKSGRIKAIAFSRSPVENLRETSVQPAGRRHAPILPTRSAAAERPTAGGIQGVIREMCSQRTEPRGERLPGPTLV